MNLKFRSQLMKVIAIIFGLYALAWGLAPYDSFNLLARFILDISDWPIDSMSESLDRNTMWLSSIGAALLGLVAVFLWGLVAPAIERGDKSVGRVTFLAFLVWYIIDGFGSVEAGVSSNVFFNTIYFALVMIPFWGMNIFKTN